MKIPFLDLRAAYDELCGELDGAYHRVMEGGWYILGEEVEAFETEWAAYCGAEHCVGVGNCLEALHLVMRAWGIGEGDEVIVPSNTYIATWLAVSMAGATPVPVEPDPATYNLDPGRIEEAVTPRTRALLPVHLYGQPADMDPIMEIAERRGFKVLADAAQAHGARHNGRRCGGLAHATAWSFYPGKNLGAFGDAGAVTTSDEDLADKVRVLRNYGSRVKYHNEVRGYNSRLDPLQAAFLRVKLGHLDEWNERRTRIAEHYLTALASQPVLELPHVPGWAEPCWHAFVVQHRDRDGLHNHMREHGIETLIHYPIPPHLSDAYRGIEWTHKSFPIAKQISTRVLSLPIGPQLSDEARIVCSQAVLAFDGNTEW